MKKFLQAAGVASLVLFGAVGCSTCCPWTSKSNCADGSCATPTTTSHSMTSGMSGMTGMTGSTSPTTMTAVPGKPPMVGANTMPATGAMSPINTGVPVGMPRN
jgi:hypothetical protein